MLTNINKVMAIILPNIGITGNFTTGEDNWGTAMNDNLLKISSLVQCSVIQTLSTKPSSPLEGVYLLSNTETTNPNSIATFLSGVWHHYQPIAGWLIFDINEEVFKYYDGSSWKPLPINSDLLSRISNIETNGIIEKEDNGFKTLDIGVNTNTSILNREHADGRYAPLTHNHPVHLSFTVEESQRDTVVFRHIFTEEYDFLGNFSGSIGRAETSSGNFAMRVLLQSSVGESFVIKGTITVQPSGQVISSTVSGSPFTAPAGSVIKIVSPDNDTTISGLSYTF